MPGKLPAERPGYTRLEIALTMVIVVLIALLVVPRLAAADTDPTQARITKAADDLRFLADTFRTYRKAHGYYPPDTATGQTPPEMRTRFATANPFAAPTPIGGRYDYDRFPNLPPVCIAIRAATDSPEPTLADALALDAHLDDGVLTTGNFRTSKFGGYIWAFDRN